MRLNEYLKDQREKKKVTLEDIRSKTKIRQEFIEAIENGEYEKLPKGLYLYGFLRLYANFLGLNPEEVIDLYRQDEYAKEKKTVQNEDSNLDKKFKKIFRKVIIFLVICIVLVVGIYYIFFNSNTEFIIESKERAFVESSVDQENVISTAFDEPLPKEEKEEKEEKKEKKIVAVPKREININKPISNETQDKLNLKFVGRHKCWLRIYADNKVAFEGIVYSGNTKKFSAYKNYKINIGDINGIIINVNGKEVDVKRNSDRGLNTIELTKENLNEWLK